MAAFRSNLCLGMVSFRKLTILQLGGEERLLKMDNVEVGCWPVSLMFRSHNVLLVQVQVDVHCSALQCIGKLLHV